MKIPLIATQLHPKTGNIVASVVFVGTVPADVFAAINRVSGTFKNLNWSVKDQKKLRDYYGVSWRKLLTPEVIEFSPDSIVGMGASMFDDFGEIEKPKKAQQPDINLTTSMHDHPIYSGYEIYDEDTINDLRNKIQAAGLTPYFRQHLYYYLNNDGPKFPYSVSYTNDIAVIPDWTQLKIADPPIVAGVPINVNYDSS